MQSIAGSSNQQASLQGSVGVKQDLNNASIGDLREISNISKEQYNKLKLKAMNEMSSDDEQHELKKSRKKE